MYPKVNFFYRHHNTTKLYISDQTADTDTDTRQSPLKPCFASIPGAHGNNNHNKLFKMVALGCRL